MVQRDHWPHFPDSKYTKRIGYCKLGRSIELDPKKFGFQGDAEAPQLLYRLARRNPDVSFEVVGRISKGPVFPYENISTPWSHREVGQAHGFADKLSYVMGARLDGMVVHVGQTGTSHECIPWSKQTWADLYANPEEHGTTPQDWAVAYTHFLIKGMNLMGDRTAGQVPIVWLVTDPRNYVKARDFKWPSGMDDMLAQYQYTREQRHERFRDPRTPEELGFGSWVKSDRGGEIWVAQHTYRYGGLELMIIPDEWPSWGQAGFYDRKTIGVASTSFSDGSPRRSEIFRDYVLSQWPDAEIFGKWDATSLKDVPPNTVNQRPPFEFPDILQRWRCTLVPPALGESWTVSKPYQCWAARVVSFLYGKVDDQGWLLPTRRESVGTMKVADTQVGPLYSVRNDWTADEITLATWLRIENPDELRKRVEAVDGSEQTWLWITGQQRALLQKRWDEAYVESEIERKLGI